MDMCILSMCLSKEKAYIVNLNDGTILGKGKQIITLCTCNFPAGLKKKSSPQELEAKVARDPFHKLTCIVSAVLCHCEELAVARIETTFQCFG